MRLLHYVGIERFKQTPGSPLLPRYSGQTPRAGLLPARIQA
jgi:hypothetical protein